MNQCWSAIADLVAGTAVAAVGLVSAARVRRTRGLPPAGGACGHQWRSAPRRPGREPAAGGR
ncbi:DUF6629 family protein [Streptomyces virginiae]|uniref:DUF6629 family protein n=1 Tax=Streptomyces virginiae TaxID=1961 RepID=UPI003445F8B0